MPPHVVSRLAAEREVVQIGAHSKRPDRAGKPAADRASRPVPPGKASPARPPSPSGSLWPAEPVWPAEPPDEATLVQPAVLPEPPGLPTSPALPTAPEQPRSAALPTAPEQPGSAAPTPGGWSPETWSPPASSSAPPSFLQLLSSLPVAGAGAVPPPAPHAGLSDLAAAGQASASRGRAAKVIGLAAAIAALLGGAVFYYYTHAGRAQAADPPGGDPPGQSQGRAPETVVSVTPATGAVGVNGAADITVAFAKPLSPTSPMPTLTPPIKGSWQRSGSSAVFHPERGFRPQSKVTVTIPGGSAGVQSASGGLLVAPVTVQFRTGRLQRVRIEQLLAQLGYLPLTWAPLTGQAALLTDPNAQLSAAYSPPQGSYTWQSGYPVELHMLWRPDRPSEILKGAVMAFEADHGLTLDGVIGPAVWHAMFRALARGAMSKHGYTYAVERQRLPEILTVWHNGHVVFRHLSNTGISIRPTAVETDPVYLRYRHQIMKGRNPNGKKYADPVSWVAYFHSGEAIHYFPRGSYGWPQSLGCIELPYAPAERVWPYLTFGTLVTVLAP